MGSSTRVTSVFSDVTSVVSTEFPPESPQTLSGEEAQFSQIPSFEAWSKTQPSFRQSFDNTPVDNAAAFAAFEEPDTQADSSSFSRSPRSLAAPIAPFPCSSFSRNQAPTERRRGEGDENTVRQADFDQRSSFEGFPSQAQWVCFRLSESFCSHLSAVALSIVSRVFWRLPEDSRRLC